jgi:hypothetical protein
LRNFSSEEKSKARLGGKKSLLVQMVTETETCANHESDYTLLQRARALGQRKIQFAIQPLLLELAEDVPASIYLDCEWFSGANITILSQIPEGDLETLDKVPDFAAVPWTRLSSCGIAIQKRRPSQDMP